MKMLTILLQAPEGGSGMGQNLIMFGLIIILGFILSAIFVYFAFISGHSSTQ